MRQKKGTISRIVRMEVSSRWSKGEAVWAMNGAKDTNGALVR